MSFNKKMLLVFAAFIVFLSFDAVKAENDGVCSSSELSALKKEARQIEFSYTFDDTPNSYRRYDMTIGVNNFNDKFYIEDDAGAEYYYVDYQEEDNKYNLGTYANGQQVTFKVYASNETDCTAKLLYTKKYKLPHYNDYSKNEECRKKENKDFEYCDKWFEYRIDSDEEFMTALKEYQEKGTHKSENEEEEQKEDKTLIAKIGDWYKSNLIIAIPLTLVIVVAIVALVYFVIKKIKDSKKKVKIDLEV